MKLVVAIDGEQSAKSALAHILKEKYASETEIHLIHVIVPGFADAPVEGIPDVVAQEKEEETGGARSYGAQTQRVTQYKCHS